MNIREPIEQDRDGLEAALRSDQSFGPDEVEVALELIEAAIASSDSYWLLVADVGGTVAGYVCFGPTPMTAAVYDLYWVVVHAAHRRQGVAARLIGAMEERLRELGACHVRVETSELEGYGAARRLYQRLGYPEAGRLPDFYRVGDALITYYKPL